MSEREPRLDKEVVRLPDGRRLIYYAFPEQPPDGASSPPEPEPPPPTEER